VLALKKLILWHKYAIECRLYWKQLPWKHTICLFINMSETMKYNNSDENPLCYRLLIQKNCRKKMRPMKNVEVYAFRLGKDIQGLQNSKPQEYPGSRPPTFHYGDCQLGSMWNRIHFQIFAWIRICIKTLPIVPGSVPFYLVVDHLLWTLFSGGLLYLNFLNVRLHCIIFSVYYLWINYAKILLLQQM
jgi:hypothetical protein